MKWGWGHWVRARHKKAREQSDNPSDRPSTKAGSLAFETLEPRVLLSANPLDVSVVLPASNAADHAISQHVGATLDSLDRGPAVSSVLDSAAPRLSADLAVDSGS